MIRVSLTLPKFHGSVSRSFILKLAPIEDEERDVEVLRQFAFTEVDPTSLFSWRLFTHVFRYQSLDCSECHHAYLAQDRLLLFMQSIALTKEDHQLCLPPRIRLLLSS
jgi:hypothetical protein